MSTINIIVIVEIFLTTIILIYIMSDRREVVVAMKTKDNMRYNAQTDREQNYIGKRIAEARKANGLNLDSFSDLLSEYGVSVGKAAINKWELGKSIPSAYQLLSICQALQIHDDLSYFMSVSPREELNEEGLKKLADYKADLIASGRYRPRNNVVDIIKYIEKPVSNLAVSAGVGEFLSEDNFEMVSFPESSVPAGADFGVRISGDSMEPVYHDGQIVWVQQCDRVCVGEVGIFIYDGEGYIKMYNEQEPAEENRADFTDSYNNLHMQPVLISYNQAYEPKEISAAAGFQVIGRVL